MEEYILNGNTLIILAGRESLYVNVPGIIKSHNDVVIDTLIFEEGIKSIVGVNDFSGKGPAEIKTVILPQSLVSIGGFSECVSLRSIKLPMSLVSIERNCFSGCIALEEAVLPDNLTSLGAYAFSRCSSLKSVHLPHSLTVIEDAVFSGCSSLCEIEIPESVTAIGEFAFSNTGIHQLVLPSSVETIGDCAFGIIFDVSNMLVRIPSDAPVYTSGAFFELDELPYYEVFDPKTTNSEATVTQSNESQSECICNHPMKNIDESQGQEFVSASDEACPRCHSHNVSQQKVHRLFSFVKAMFLFIFPPFLLLGFIGKNRIECCCHSCGQKWEKKPPQFSMETLGEWFMYI